MRDLTDIEPPEPDATLDEYIQSYGIEHFSAKECRTLRRLQVTAPEPPRGLWANIIPTLWLAEELRKRMNADHGTAEEFGLAVGNGYRPKDLNRRAGGARRSRHITFSALDLDLPHSIARNPAAQTALYAIACEIFLEHGEEYGMGLGLYRPWGGRRVHIDTGRRRPAHWKRRYTKPLLESLR